MLQAEQRFLCIHTLQGVHRKGRTTMRSRECCRTAMTLRNGDKWKQSNSHLTYSTSPSHRSACCTDFTTYQSFSLFTAVSLKTTPNGWTAREGDVARSSRSTGAASVATGRPPSYRPTRSMTALGQQHHHHPHPPIHEATMRFLLHKYLSKNAPGAKNDQPGMPPPPSVGAEPDNGCLAGCVPVRTKRGTTASTAGATTTTSTTRTSRQNFVKSAATTLFPSTVQFTNHESLPALPDAYSGFVAAFPQYGGVGQADAIRDGEYQHLDRHVCLDYTGINLFSHAQMNASVPSTSATPPAAASVLWQPPFFDIAYKSTSLRSQVQCGGDGGAGIEAAMTKRIMASLKIPEDEYRMVCTANRTTAFRLLAESYSFQPGKKLLAVYDYESEAVAAMAESAQRRGADIMSASFTWPSMRVHSPELRKKLARGRRRGRQPRRGLFVYPLLSRMTGARYPYLWMSLAQEHGWHVALDACGLGTKDLDTLGLSLIRPDFIVCNFFKVFGENPSGFAGLFVKKSSCDGLEASTIARSIGIVSIVPARRWSLHEDYSNSTDLEGAYSLSLHRTIEATPDADADADADADTASSFSGPITAANYSTASAGKAVEADTAEHGETSEIRDDVAAGTMEVEAERAKNEHEVAIEIECRGLDHADELGLIHIGNRLRCITNWLIVAMQKLRHPHAEDGRPLVRVYGPRVKFERGPSVAFNVYDWKGEKVAPALVQKLADRHNISLTCGFLRNIWFADKYEADKNAVLEHRAAAGSAGAVGGSGKRKDSGGDMGIYVVNASLGFLSNFEDAHRLWAFVAKFLDADFVEKERWRYTALNQKTVEV